MDAIIEIVLKGIIIGLCISVPLGPIGMLCVNRTLHHGRLHGFVTGLGATTSDFLYTLVVLFFLSVVVEFIDRHLFLFQLAGSFLICCFGFYIFKSHPSAQPQPNETQNNSILRDYISSFGLTFSNPLIIFVLLALFTRFTFISQSSNIFYIIFGLISIIIGACAWWSALTFIVSHFRKKFNLRELKIMNRITGLIIIIIGIIGFAVSFWG